MSFLSRVLRFLFWLLVLSWGVRLLRRAVAWMARGGTPAAPPQGVDVAGSSEALGIGRRLVRDPVCGVHVAEVLAIPLREGSETYHFCSVACRDEFVRSAGDKGENQIAANG